MKTVKPNVAIATPPPRESEGGTRRPQPIWRPYPCLLSRRELQQEVAALLD